MFQLKALKLPSSTFLPFSLICRAITLCTMFHISNCYSIRSEQKAKYKERNTASFWQYECVVAIPFIKRYAGGLLGGWWASFHHVYISHRSVWSQFHLSSIGPLHCISGFKIVFLRPEDKITYSYYIYIV